MKKLPVSYYKNRKEYIIFNNDCGVSDMARKGGIYEHYIFDYIREKIDIKGKNIIDIGANFGFHTLEFAELVEHGHVFSFEPQKLVYYQLCGNVILNGFDKNIGNAHLDACYDNGYNLVNVNTLDSYNFENVSILKIDVQGYEPRVLDGAKETINKNKPTIFIEVEEPQLNVYGMESKDIFERLDALGYEYKKTIDASHLVDYVATPK